MNRVILAACASWMLAPAAFAQTENQTASATFLSTEGVELGTASLTDTPNGVLMELEVGGLTPRSWVAFHVHETGECDPETGFDSAGGHFNPTDMEHGYMVEGGPHAGDMPNQYVDADGILRAQVFNSFVRLGEGDADISDRALMIHGGTDDYESQPSGDAGARIACGVIEQG